MLVGRYCKDKNPQESLKLMDLNIANPKHYGITLAINSLTKIIMLAATLCAFMVVSWLQDFSLLRSSLSIAWCAEFGYWHFLLEMYLIFHMK